MTVRLRRFSMNLVSDHEHPRRPGVFSIGKIEQRPCRLLFEEEEFRLLPKQVSDAPGLGVVRRESPVSWCVSRVRFAKQAASSSLESR